MANKMHLELGFDAESFMRTPPSTSWNHGEDTWLYLMACSDSIFKVGIASNVERRRIALQACCPIPIYVVRTVHYDSRLYALLAERTAHSLLANHRLHGEWFHCERRHIGKVMSLVKMEMPKLIYKHEQYWRAKRAAMQDRYETDEDFRKAMDERREEVNAEWERIQTAAMGSAVDDELTQA